MISTHSNITPVKEANEVKTRTSSFMVNNSNSNVGVSDKGIQSSASSLDSLRLREQAESRRSASWSLLVSALSNSNDPRDRKEADILMSCRGYVSKVTTPEGKSTLRSFARSCNHRFCSHCEKRRREETKAKLVAASKLLVTRYDPSKYMYMWVTLTLDPNHPSVPRDTRDKLIFLRKQGTRYLARKQVKDLVLGSYCKIETGGKNNNSDHHHIHMLAVCDSAIHQSTVETLERNWNYGHSKVKVWKVAEEANEASLEMSKPTLSRYLGKVALYPLEVSEEKLRRTVAAYRGRRVTWSTGVIKKALQEVSEMSYDDILEGETLPTREQDPEPVEPTDCDKLPDGNYTPLMLLRYINSNSKHSKYAMYLLNYYDWSLRETRRVRIQERLEHIHESIPIKYTQ